ncbi:GspH/FimT family pseudopilin [Amphritea sp. 1_MG-2023]|uniref:GspH/FimT family pseudopilin n=1 Tax=Amphritea sp. 1_MG-2023 TaxID=3062670 RepID=UPI0026E38876|nr:GspH/FimT family pseudopilin [Amphritea sp. 1_MG-2023]MDO6563633.1 GspH/FimT family pseudopilin [Amphritea sp. 1_MG-2023]
MVSQKQRGFSLIELMVVLSILVILITIGVPSLSGYLNSQRLNTVTQLIKDSYSQARYEAVSRKKAVTLCPLDISTVSCGKQWGEGVMVYIDENGDGAFNMADDQRLRQADFPEGVTVTLKNRSQVRISSSGATSDSGTFLISVSGSTTQNSLIISSAGRIRLG